MTATVQPPAPTTFRGHLHALNGAQKNGAGVPAYMRWINRRLARVIAAASATIGLTPNMVTAFSAALSGAGLAIMIVFPPSWWSAPLTGVLLAAGFVFDSADGQVARLTGRSSPAGEWLDHVVDAVRTPMIHLSVAVAVVLHLPDLILLAVVALLFTVMSVGQFMSQILAEQLVRDDDGHQPEGRGIRKSVMLLPTDTGVLCWSFVLWAVPPLFAVSYGALFVINLVHTAASMRRKFLKLASL
ncbi:CDP-alcohol phosphatidyltransferase family protein [uncultured Microbacterium sp.]|uniref:CDP-alcohol phosphatidyltransferase family protein n=1 Tax=uncultured Microbacterium sp. TaxID=191216 RepID=UPI00260C4941|nr:CDP-alcohol phosphatidyltransferase family protein [uncultured Microbacterium sp.]